MIHGKNVLPAALTFLAFAGVLLMTGCGRKKDAPSAPLQSTGLTATGTAPSAQTSAASGIVDSGIEKGRQGDFEGAATLFEKAISVDPTYAPAYKNLGFAHVLLHRVDDAISDYDKALVCNPNYLDAYLFRGVAKGLKGDNDGSIADFTHVISMSPTNAQAYSNRGHARYLKGDLDDAAKDLDQSIVLDSKAGSNYFLRGLILNAKKDAAHASADFQKSAATGFPYGALWLWITESEAGNVADAHIHLADFMSKVKADEWPAPIGTFLLDKISQDQLIAKADGKDHQCEAWFYAGMAKRVAGDEAGALDCFHHSIETNSTDSEALFEAKREAAKAGH